MTGNNSPWYKKKQIIAALIGGIAVVIGAIIVSRCQSPTKQSTLNVNAPINQISTQNVGNNIIAGGDVNITQQGIPVEEYSKVIQKLTEKDIKVKDLTKEKKSIENQRQKTKQAIKYLSEGKCDKAVEHFEPVSNDIKEFPWLAYYYGKSLNCIGRFKEALRVLNFVPECEDHKDLNMIKGIIYYNLKNYHESVINLSKALNDLGINDYKYWPIKAYLVISKGKISSLKNYENDVNVNLNLIDSELFNLKHITIPKGGTIDFKAEMFYPDFSRRLAAFLLINNLAITYYNNKKYKKCMKLTYESKKYFVNHLTTRLIGFNFSEKKYLYLLESLNFSAYHLRRLRREFDESYYINFIKYVEDFCSKSGYSQAVEMSKIIRSFYGDTTELTRINHSFELTFAFSFIDDYGLKALLLESPPQLFDDMEINLGGKKNFNYDRKLRIDPPISFNEDLYIKAIAENIHGAKSPPLIIVPMIKPIY